MENVISKRQKDKKSVTNTESPAHFLRHRTLKEALKDPFIRKKHEEAKATLKKYPIPEEFLHKNIAQKGNLKTR